MTPQSLCILRLSAIGDTCNLVPVVRTLRKTWPTTAITWIIGRTEHQLLAGIGDVEFITFDKRAGRAGRRALKKRLVGRQFDILLHMHASMRANLVSRYVDAPRKIGFDRKRARDFQWLFCNEHIAERASAHVVDGFFQFLEALSIEERHLYWDIPINSEARAQAVETVTEPALVISPCSSQRWRNFRNWRAANYAHVVDYAYKEFGLRTVLTGGPTELEKSYGRDIERLAHTTVTNLIGQTSLPELLAVLERAHVLICPDSGPAHMATAVGTPVIGLYAASNRWRTGPLLSQQWVVDRYPDAVAQALGKPVAQLPWGYRVRTPYAMNLITVDDVSKKLAALMEANRILSD